MRYTIVILVAIAAFITAAPASAQLVAHPKCDSLACRQASQKQNLAHARYLCNRGRHEVKRWGCHAVQWLTRELHETETALRPRVAVAQSSGYQGLAAIPYAVAFCESGGNPYNERNPKYRGKWQFDQGTWNAFAPPAWRGHDPATVPESIQDETALRVTYDAWPNC